MQGHFTLKCFSGKRGFLSLGNVSDFRAPFPLTVKLRGIAMKRSNMWLTGFILITGVVLSVGLAFADTAWVRLDIDATYPNAPIYDFWGTSESNIFAVGANFTQGGQQSSYGLILHYNGSNWTEMNSGNSKWLYCIWGESGSNIFAAGEHISGNGIILKYNGTSWDESFEAGSSISDIWGTSASNVYAVGGGTIYHYDGVTWTTVYTSGVDPFYWINGIWGTSEQDIVAVGFYTENSEEKFVILHYNGMDWSVMDTGSGGRLMSVWGSSGSDIFAVGYPGIYHYDGSNWSQMVSSGPLSTYVYAIWGTSGSNVFAGKMDGAIYHYDGTSWTQMDTGGNNKVIWNIWGISANNVYAGGNNGTILHYYTGTADGGDGDGTDGTDTNGGDVDGGDVSGGEVSSGGGSGCFITDSMD
jgi:hypothetical protein